MIGILSGAGPLAGVDVAKKLIEETIATLDQDHLPLMLSSIPAEIPDRSQFLLGKSSNNPAHGIAKLFLHLESTGVTVAALACNTAHAKPIFEVVEGVLEKSSSRLQVLHIVHETIAYIQKHFAKGTKIGVLSTSGTKHLGLYRDALEALDFKVLEPNDEQQELVQSAIYHPEFGIKAKSSPVDGRATDSLKSIMGILKNQGAEVFVLGCTELPLAIEDRVFENIPILDPNRILARSLIRAYAPLKLKKSNAF